jgi:uncharacterized membrane protein (DUF373 family)
LAALRALTTLLCSLSILLSTLTLRSTIAELPTTAGLRLLTDTVFAAIVLVELIARVELCATSAASEVLHLGHV